MHKAARKARTLGPSCVFSPCLPQACALDLNLLDHTDPAAVIQISVREFRDKCKHLIRKSADVQDVAAFLGLCVSVRLNIDADEFRIAVSRFELTPLFHRLGRAAAKTSVV